MDISNLCRSCMKVVASWEREKYQTESVDMFCYCTNIKITEEDKLPKQFCYNCIRKIESSFTFIREAHKSDVTLKNIISRTNTSVIVQPDGRMKTDIDYENVDNATKSTLPNCEFNGSVKYEENTIANNFNDRTSHHSDDDCHNDILSNEWSTKEMAMTKEECATGLQNTDENKKNICPVCRKNFSSKVWFAKHMENAHTGDGYTCGYCSKIFSKPDQLRSHSVSHSEERRFTCDVCPKKFKRRKQLKMHSRVHNDARPYECDKCHMRFKQKSGLTCHMKVHEGHKPYLCYFCGSSFAQATNLDVHMRTHTGQKPFSCKHCDFRTAVVCNLRRHEKKHQKVYTHICVQCRKGFYDASSLARHTRIHTGERPYKCPVCATAFVDSWKRKTHLMRAHKLQLQDIPRMRRDGGTVQ